MVRGMRPAVTRAVIFALAAAFAMSLALTRTIPGGVADVADESVRLQLHFIGASIYEHHNRSGKWPAQPADLAGTSLPASLPYWKMLLDDELVIVVWHKSLKPEPKDNAGQILAYYNKGLISARGRNWVCWGDLRTEYIKTEDLKAYLAQRKD